MKNTTPYVYNILMENFYMYIFFYLYINDKISVACGETTEIAI